MDIRHRPLFTNTYSTIDEFVPKVGSIYIFGESPEKRSIHLENWKTKTSDVKFIRIEELHSNEFIAHEDSSTTRISLRNLDQLSTLWSKISRNVVYIDITGLSHHIWAPLLKIGIANCGNVIAVYVEPAHYNFSTAVKEGEIFDLSERIKGISPLPGFISLKEPSDEKVCFVPLLGFEGARFAYINEQVQPPGDKILPIVGVPGFRPEYPFFTYHGNQLPLMQTQSWRNIRYATANCPFSLFYVLDDIAALYPSIFLKIAPIGTKPHALGAVLYSIVNNENSELIYDHPIRKVNRTDGSSRLLAYHISAFISSTSPYEIN